MKCSYKPASEAEIIRRCDKDIAENSGDISWVYWKAELLEMNQNGMCKTFVVLYGDDPIGEGTLLFSPECDAVFGRTELADGITVANINALRIDKQHEGKGHISELIKNMERYAGDNGYEALTIGVEAKEARNLAIYLHWGYNELVLHEIENDSLVLYYSKRLSES